MNARNSFDKELELLHVDLIKMGGMAEEAIDNSVEAILSRDSEKAQEVVANDDEIDEMEKKIEARCLSLILRQQPVASDLRKISSALKMITDIERIADNAADIAEISLSIKGDHIENMVKHIPQMAKISSSMVHGAIDSFVRNDIDFAKNIIERDDEVDELFLNVRDELADTLKNDKDIFNNSIDFLMIAKYLERIADHAVNICEWVLFLETGVHKDIKII